MFRMINFIVSSLQSMHMPRHLPGHDAGAPTGNRKRLPQCGAYDLEGMAMRGVKRCQHACPSILAYLAKYLKIVGKESLHTNFTDSPNPS